MTDDNWPFFKEMLIRLSEVTSMPNGKSVDNVAVTLFHLLRPYSLEKVKSAIYEALRECKYFPSYNEIMNFIEGDADELALIAWYNVYRAASLTNGNTNVKFTNDPATHWALQQMGDWETLGWKIRREGQFLKYEFTRLYKVALKRKIGWKDVRPELPGTFRHVTYIVASDGTMEKRKALPT